MKTFLARLIRAPIMAIVLMTGLLAMVPVEASALVVGKNMPAMDRASPMEYSDQATVDLTKETAIGQPVARAGPIAATIVSASLLVRNEHLALIDNAAITTVNANSAIEITGVRSRGSTQLISRRC